MISKKLNNLNAWADARLSKYFPAVRKAVLLIVIPAWIIVMVYFFNILTEVIREEDYPTALAYEARLAAIKPDLPVKAEVNYLSNSTEQDDFIIAEYVLIPVRLVEGLKPMQDLLIFQNFNTAEMPKIEGYHLKKNYGNGVMLYQRNK